MCEQQYDNHSVLNILLSQLVSSYLVSVAVRCSPYLPLLRLEVTVAQAVSTCSVLGGPVKKYMQTSTTRSGVCVSKQSHTFLN